LAHGLILVWRITPCGEPGTAHHWHSWHTEIYRKYRKDNI